MGCNLRDLTSPETIDLNSLSGKRVGVDAFLTAFQFLTTMRDRSPQGDGGPLRAENGKVVSHLMGFLNRTTTLLAAGIKPVFVFDGTPPELKAEEIAQRRARRVEAERIHKEALAAGDFPLAQKMAQRIMQYQAALQLASQAPQMYNLPLLHRQMLEVLGIRDASKIIPSDDDMKPTDPISENMNLMIGEPVKAFIYQDHQAHIEAHTAAMNDPKIAELLNLAPDAEMKQAALAAHIAEHVAFQYRRDIEKELGVPLPPVDSSLPEDIEYRLSQLVAPAAEQLTGKAQQMVQAEQMAAQAEDPVLQLQKAELEIDAAKVQSKAATDMARIQADLTKAAAKDDLERDKLKAEQKIEGAKLGVKIAETNTKEELETKKIASRNKIEGAKLGTEIAKELMIDERERDIEEMIDKRDTTREEMIDDRERDE